MTTTQPDSRTPVFSLLFNRLLYGGFVLVALYFLAKGEPTEALPNLAIALAADPIEPSRSWGQRPLWQRAWLIGHLLAVLVLLALVLLQ